MPSTRQARRCHATRRDGACCTQYAVVGTTVCRMHGGTAPQVRAAAAERKLDAQVRRALAQLDVPAVADPLTELAKVAGQVVAWKDALAARVNELTSLRYSASGAGTEQLRAEVALWERALDRCAAVLGMIAKLNLDDRLVAIGERQADMVVGALTAGLAEAGVTGPAAEAARKATARHLRVLNAGDAS